MLMEWLTNGLKTVMALLPLYALRLVAALVIIVVGRWIAKYLRGLVSRVLAKRETDAAVVSLAASVTYVLIMVAVFLAALSQIGVQVTAFVAVLGAAALAIGLALQGSLANLAAGVLLLIFRPFKAGDFVEAAGISGVVEEMHIFTTQLRTGDNRLVIVPNAKLTGDNIINYTAKDTRRVDLVVGVGYGEDLSRVKQVLSDILSADSRVLSDPEPTIGVLQLADSSVNLAVRPWVATADYWDVYFATMEAVKTRFDAEGINIPFPQMDVHLPDRAD
jgi:small conductance mechanosensitive channel